MLLIVEQETRGQQETEVRVTIGVRVTFLIEPEIISLIIYRSPGAVVTVVPPICFASLTSCSRHSHG